jgi:tetratricopeptide (TPR) repeat protein
MKLSVVEKEVLGVERIDDVPGFLAPMIYFDYVERKDPEGMIKILKHNEIDILSLITLYSHLSFQILEVDQNQTIQEKYEVGRWLNNLGEISSAQNIYLGIENDDESRAFVNSQIQLGYIFKKQKDFNQSLDFFIKVINKSGFPDLQIEACVEAAKIMEHQNKEYKEAINHCDLALGLMKQGYEHRKITFSDLKKRRDRNHKKSISKVKLLVN